jgi:flagellar FliJ protein
MAKFNFRYQKLLNLKKEFEDEIKNGLAVEIQKSIQLKTKLKNNKKDQKQYLESVNDLLKEGIKASELKRHNKNKEYFNKMNKRLLREIRKQAERVSKKREELNTAVQETKKFEKIKEKHYEIFINEVYEAERKQVDEIVNYKNYQSSGDDHGK